MHPRCHILTPRHLRRLAEFDPESGFVDAGCILERGHDGSHANPTGTGQVVLWEDDFSCDCCEPDEDERCIVYRNVTINAFDAGDRSLNRSAI